MEWQTCGNLFEGSEGSLLWCERCDELSKKSHSDGRHNFTFFFPCLCQVVALCWLLDCHMDRDDGADDVHELFNSCIDQFWMFHFLLPPPPLLPLRCSLQQWKPTWLQFSLFTDWIASVVVFVHCRPRSFPPFQSWFDLDRGSVSSGVGDGLLVFWHEWNRLEPAGEDQDLKEEEEEDLKKMRRFCYCLLIIKYHHNDNTAFEWIDSIQTEMSEKKKKKKRKIEEERTDETNWRLTIVIRWSISGSSSSTNSTSSRAQKRRKEKRERWSWHLHRLPSSTHKTNNW